MRLGVSEQSWVGALVGGFVGGIAIATTWRFSPQKDAWDIVAALGTVGAAAVALFLANRDSRKRDREAMDRAALAAASLSHRLTMTSDDVNKLYMEIRTAGRFDCDPRSFIAWHQKIESLDHLGAAEIAPLIPLGHGCAPGIAAAQDRLVVVSRLLVQFSVGGNLYNDEARKERAHSVAPLVGTAADLLERAAIECRKAASPAVWL